MLNEHEKVILFIIGGLSELQDKGLVGCSISTPKGLAVYDQLKTTGYRPTLHQVADGLSALKPDILDDEKKCLLVLFQEFFGCPEEKEAQ